MIKSINRLGVVICIVIFILTACKKDVIEPPAPPIAEFKSTPQAALLDLNQSSDPNDLSRQLYSARHILNVSGVPYFETSDINIAINSSLILISSPLDIGVLTPKEVSVLSSWVDSGGVIIAPTCEDIALQSLFGFSGVPSYHRNRYLMSWVSEAYPELSYFDHENEKTISLGKNENGSNVIKSYGYSLNDTGKALAHFETGEVAVIRNIKGDGRAYLFGIEWRDVIQRSQLNRDFEAQRVYVNGFEPTADVFPLFVRSVWSDIQPVSVWKHTIPGGYKTALIVTHDVDATSGYNLMGYMSEYEKAAGIRATYFITTRYINDDIASSYYDEESLKLTREVIANGHQIGSHSVGHFPDFSNDELFPLGSTSVTKESYNPKYLNGKTENATTYGEIKVSKDIIESDYNIKVRTFRPGHLLTNSFVTEGLSQLNYSFHSSFTACDLLSAFPFSERIGYNWGGELSSILQIPINISDADFTRENYTEKIVAWEEVLDALKDNYAPCVLLVHPNRKWKADAQKNWTDKIDRTECGMYDIEEYGDFWRSRDSFEFEFDYQKESKQLVIRASKASINGVATLGIMVKSELPIDGYRLIDSDFTEYPISVKSFGDGTILVVIE